MKAWMIPASKELSAFIAPLSLIAQSIAVFQGAVFQSHILLGHFMAVSQGHSKHLSHGRSWLSRRGLISVMKQVLQRNFLGELSVHKQCVPGSLLSFHAWEPGNESCHFIQLWSLHEILILIRKIISSLIKSTDYIITRLCVRVNYINPHPRTGTCLPTLLPAIWSTCGGSHWGRQRWSWLEHSLDTGERSHRSALSLIQVPRSF